MKYATEGHTFPYSFLILIDPLWILHVPQWPMWPCGKFLVLSVVLLEDVRTLRKWGLLGVLWLTKRILRLRASPFLFLSLPSHGESNFHLPHFPGMKRSFQYSAIYHIRESLLTYLPTHGKIRKSPQEAKPILETWEGDHLQRGLGPKSSFGLHFGTLSKEVRFPIKRVCGTSGRSALVV